MYRALLVCNSRFPHDAAALVELHGPKTDGIVLRDALTHHETGIFDKNDVQVVNEGRSHEVSRVIDDFFSTSEPDDTLLLYYSGHGRTMDQQLFLCTQDTVSDRLYSSAVSGETLKAIVSSSRAQAKVLILDCCYGGMMKGELALEGFRGNGRYIIAATSATDLASDASRRGLPSPFTEILAEALLSGADDDDGDGSVDLDDLYAFLTSAPFGGPRPHRIFDGSGTIPIARRRKAPSEPEPEGESPPLAYELRPSKLISADGHMGAASFLDTPLGGISFDAAQVAEFRRLMREDVIRFLPDELAENEFLQEAGFLRNGQLTYAGLLLFGERPTTVLPSAMIQCVRFYGNEKTDSSKTVDLQGPISELIIKARDFIADLARLGEQPTTEGAYAETVYRYPMIAVREIIANAVVHRDYQLHESCVQILVFADRIQVISP